MSSTAHDSSKPEHSDCVLERTEFSLTLAISQINFSEHGSPLILPPLLHNLLSEARVKLQFVLKLFP